MTSGRRLAEACVLIPRVLADAATEVRGCVVIGGRLTGTDMALIVLAPRDERPSEVVKLPLSAAAARGLTRESAVLATLAGDERLGEWRSLLPRVLAAGAVHGQPYRIDTALPGRPAAPAHQDAAVAAIAHLHRATASPCAGDPERWVDAPLRELARHGAVARCERLREELHGALAGCAFAGSWIHGDYWLGNLLARDDGLAGIVDWEAAGAGELALHDVLHLVFAQRRAQSGAQLGALVRSQLVQGGWTARERSTLERHARWCHDGSLSDRHAVLLYWLRQAAVHARQRGRRGGLHYRVWRQRNVDAVLTAL